MPCQTRHRLIPSLIFVLCGGISAAQAQHPFKQSIELTTELQRQLQKRPLPPRTPDCHGSQCSSKTVTDSLIKNLDCSELSLQTVLTYLQENAFDSSRHIPRENFETPFPLLSGVGVEQYKMGQCWAFAATQRRFFYLARLKQKDTEPLHSNPATHPSWKTILALAGEEDTQFEPFPIQEDHLSGLYIPFASPDFSSAIIKHQKDRFFRAQNADMLFGGKSRSESTNQETLQDIQQQLKQGRMPLLIRRGDAKKMHAILAKKVEEKNGKYTITIYDSSNPTKNHSMYYENGHFYTTTEITNPHRTPVGLFIRDDEEMDQIQNSLFEYYKNLCNQLRR